MNIVEKTCGILVIFIISLCLVSTSYAAGNDAKVIFLKGSPKIMKLDTNQWNNCAIDMAVNNGDRIKTSKGEEANISFADKTGTVRIKELSDVFIKKNTPPYSVELLNGSAMASIKSLPSNSSFEIRTPTGVSGARGTGWEATTDGRTSSFGSFEDSIYVKGIDQSGRDMEGELIVDSGWKTTLDRFEKPSGLEKLSDREISDWNSWKDSVDKGQGQSGDSGKGGPGGPGGPGNASGGTPASGSEGNENLIVKAESRLDNAGAMERRIDTLENKKDSVLESRDQQRILDREESLPHDSTSSSVSPHT